MNQFIVEDANRVHLKEIFNEEHAAMMFEEKLQKKPEFHHLHLHNVGVKIMRLAFERFQEQGITSAKIDYDWNQIMMMPKLVCYDKNTWKTLQQLANWNKQWAAIFRPCLSLEEVEANIFCSWADQGFIKAFLQGIAALPNIKKVKICVKTKHRGVQNLLEAFKKANIFPSMETMFANA